MDKEVLLKEDKEVKEDKEAKEGKEVQLLHKEVNRDQIVLVQIALEDSNPLLHVSINFKYALQMLTEHLILHHTSI